MREIADGVFEIRLGYVNLHLVVVDDGVVLVDTGLPGRTAAVEKGLAEARRSVGEIRTILLTHRHADHIGCAADLRRRSGARTVAHAIEAPAITGEAPVRMTGVMRVVERIMKEPEPVPVDETITADGPMSVPGFSAVHTPGHTAGHVSFLLDRAGGVLFAGDAVGGGRGGRIRLAPRIVSVDRAVETASAKRLAGLAFEVAVFGHGRAVCGGAVQRFREFAARA